MINEQKKMERNKRKWATQRKYRQTTLTGKFETTRCAMKKRATQKGIPFDLTSSYLAEIMPLMCPILGIPLLHNTGGGKATINSPSVDRLIPNKGYVEGNVIVISHLANMIRSCATPDQIIAVGNFYKNLLTPDPNSCKIDSED